MCGVGQNSRTCSHRKSDASGSWPAAEPDVLAQRAALLERGSSSIETASVAISTIGSKGCVTRPDSSCCHTRSRFATQASDPQSGSGGEPNARALQHDPGPKANLRASRLATLDAQAEARRRGVRDNVFKQPVGVVEGAARAAGGADNTHAFDAPSRQQRGRPSHPPLLQGMLERAFASSPLARSLDGVDLDAVLACGRELVEAEPMTIARLRQALGGVWREYDANSLA
jgi:hypothetical protein